MYTQGRRENLTLCGALHNYVAGGVNGPDFPDTTGNEVLGVPLKQASSEAPTGGWDVRKTLLYFEVPRFHFPKPALKEGQLGVSAKSKARPVSRASVPCCNGCSLTSKLIKVH